VIDLKPGSVILCNPCRYWARTGLLIRRSLVRAQVGEPRYREGLCRAGAAPSQISLNDAGQPWDKTPHGPKGGSPLEPLVFKEHLVATIEQRAGGTYRARIRRNGAPDLSRSFDTRQDAVHWAAETEGAIRAGRLQEHLHRTTTLGDLLMAYRDEVTPSKKGKVAEYNRCEQLRRDRIADFSLENLTRPVMRDFRDRRLKTVSGSTVNRELALVSVVLRWAQSEHDAPVDLTVLNGLKQTENDARERRLEPGELEALMAAAPSWMQSYITVAVETCMRRGELVDLTWDRVDLRRRVAVLLTAKNGQGRRVPLSGVALRVLESLPRPIGGGRVFPVHADTVSSVFADCCKAAGIVGLRLHDLRAEGVCRLFEAGHDLNTVKAVSGHKSAILMRYCRASDAEALALRLA
jgi:integrase